eukprot:gene15852-biopygen6708
MTKTSFHAARGNHGNDRFWGGGELPAQECGGGELPAGGTAATTMVVQNTSICFGRLRRPKVFFRTRHGTVVVSMDTPMSAWARPPPPVSRTCSPPRQEPSKETGQATLLKHRTRSAPGRSRRCRT